MPGWHSLSRGQRASDVADWLDSSVEGVLEAVACGGLDAEAADRLVENVIGTYGLPFAVATNFRINDVDTLVPMVIEEPSVVAASSNAARIVREGGGFRVHADDPRMACQVQVFTDDLDAARKRILADRSKILGIAASADEMLGRAGGGPVDLEVRTVDGGDPGERFLVVHLIVDVRDAMGANAVNTMGEAVAPRLEEITDGRTGLRILTNLADKRLVTVEADIPASALVVSGFPADAVLDGIVAASRFAELDPYRAATHNKGVMNGTDAVILATGNDWRAVEAGAHAFASSQGRYMPLCVWRRGEGDTLSGRLVMPMAVGLVGGATKVHPAACLAVRIMGASGASDLAGIAASAGMATNLAALRALATEGIQRGHMRLHSRSRELEG